MDELKDALTHTRATLEVIYELMSDAHRAPHTTLDAVRLPHAMAMASVDRAAEIVRTMQRPR